MGAEKGAHGKEAINVLNGDDPCLIHGNECQKHSSLLKMRKDGPTNKDKIAHGCSDLSFSSWVGKLIPNFPNF